MNESLNVRLKAESWTYWKGPLKQEKYPYKWSTIEDKSINNGTSENIIWSDSSIQMWSTSKDWKIYLLKSFFKKVHTAGPSEEII